MYPTDLLSKNIKALWNTEIVIFLRFILFHINAIAFCSVPLIFLGSSFAGKIYQIFFPWEDLAYTIMQRLFESNMDRAHSIFYYFINLTILLAFIATCLLISMAFTYMHRKILTHYIPRHIELKRTGTLSDDAKFIFTWLAIGACFHIPMQLVLSSDFLYRFLSLYFVQTTIFYFLVSFHYCQYKLTLRTPPL